MAWRIRLGGLIGIFLVVFFPSPALAEDLGFGVSPA